MDPLTHSLFGAALARTPLGRGTRLARAALVLGANLPDVDVLSHFAGSDAAFGFRRGWTHGPLALLVLPPLLTGALLGWARMRPTASVLVPRRLLALSYLGCLTHPLLDLLNTYGIRLMMPFSDRWFYGDSLFIVDPWLWLVIGGATFLGKQRHGVPWGWLVLAGAPTFAVLKAGRILPDAVPLVWAGGLASIVALHFVLARRTIRRELLAAAGLLVAVGYIGVMVGLSHAGERWLRAELDRQGIAGVGRLMVGPAPAQPLLWEVVAETSDSYHHGVLRWQPAPVLTLASPPLPRPDMSVPAVAASRSAPHARGTLDWMRFPWVRPERVASGWNVEWFDARYVVPPQPSRGNFGRLTVRLDDALQPLPD